MRPFSNESRIACSTEYYKWRAIYDFAKQYDGKRGVKFMGCFGCHKSTLKAGQKELIVTPETTKEEIIEFVKQHEK